MSALFAVRGNAIHAPARGALEFLSDWLIAVDGAGAIVGAGPANAGDTGALAARLRDRGAVTELPDGQYLLPGLVDLHVHAPQWPQLGTALDVPLEDWLLKYTFPLEARYADLAFARTVYASLVDSLLANGTTTAMYYGTIHRAATLELARICIAKGQRAAIGRVAMDDARQCPAYYRDASAAQSVSETRAFIGDLRALPGNPGRVVPVVTPRFIPTCTDAALAGLGSLAREAGCPIQTHCSESDWEHGHVMTRTGLRDAAALEKFGLLGRRTVLAHGTLMNDDDFARLKAAGAAVAHCPLSNIYFGDAAFPLRRALDRGVHVGLGTDIAGGPSASIFESCRAAIGSARALEHGLDGRREAPSRGRGGSRIDFREALWLATAGGGDALDLPVGRFAPGYRFDAIAIDTAAAGSDLKIWPDLDRPDDIAQKIVTGATRANVARVWVDGRVVSGQPGGSRPARYRRK